MSTRIRLARYGAKKRPFYRIIVTDQRTPSGRRKLELIGTYDPRKEPLECRIDADKLRHWLSLGAEPSDTVAQLIKRSGILSGASKVVAAAPAPQVAEAPAPHVAEEPAAPVEESAPVEEPQA